VGISNSLRAPKLVWPFEWQWMNLVLLVIARAAFGLSVAYFAYQTAVGQ
jgi:hypothetical protein